jgi:4-alpha-glucanotransferase
MGSPAEVRLLHQLARLYRVQTAYSDVSHHRRQAPVEVLLAVLKSLGAPLATLKDVPSAWRERQQELWRRPLEPVTAGAGEPPLIKVRLPSNLADASLNCYLNLETGQQQRWQWHGAEVPTVEAAEVEGINYVVKLLALPDGLPWGYHRFALELPGGYQETLVIVAPDKAYLPPENREHRIWGLFLPLYALQTESSWGSGDFTDLEALMSWCAQMGGQVVATLPLLPTFLGEEAFEPSPYLPVSRRLWNEFYLDISRVPELEKCPNAQARLASPDFQKELDDLCRLPLVDYRRQMALKRQVLEQLCQCLFAEPSQRLEALNRFAQVNPPVEEYARFRAAGEKQAKPWRSWPQRLREGNLREGDYREEDRRYHLYVQWLAQQQVQALAQTAREKDLQFYLDLPVGVHPDGFDVWREQAIFAGEVSAGAPPDTVFTSGQDWEFPPLHPEKIREHGYQYVIDYLRHHLRQADILRIDHAMGLHRLFWIPKGLEASQGVYVRYPTQELYAILALESHRHKTVIVGENLGTVPPEVKPAMNRHGFHSLYVLPYELALNRRTALKSIPGRSVASLNTHDMPPFAAFWEGLDIKQRLRLGLLDKAEAQKEGQERRAIKKELFTFLVERGWIKPAEVNTYSALKACLTLLSTSQARVVLVNLEDLWLETRPQNIPATRGKNPNWRSKAKYSLETLCQMPQVVDTLKIVDQLRKQPGR